MSTDEAERSAREVHLGHELEVRQQAEARQRERGREVLHRQHTGYDKTRVRRAAVGKFANFPNTTYTAAVNTGTRIAQATPRNVCL
jgi:hypothetical protein